MMKRGWVLIKDFDLPEYKTQEDYKEYAPYIRGLNSKMNENMAGSPYFKFERKKMSRFYWDQQDMFSELLAQYGYRPGSNEKVFMLLMHRWGLAKWIDENYDSLRETWKDEWAQKQRRIQKSIDARKKSEHKRENKFRELWQKQIKS